MHLLTLSSGQPSGTCRAILKGEFSATLLGFLGSNTTSSCAKKSSTRGHCLISSLLKNSFGSSF
jgi:hypothetical protein